MAFVLDFVLNAGVPVDPTGDHSLLQSSGAMVRSILPRPTGDSHVGTCCRAHSIWRMHSSATRIQCSVAYGPRSTGSGTSGWFTNTFASRSAIASLKLPLFPPTHSPQARHLPAWYACPTTAHENSCLFTASPAPCACRQSRARAWCR
jgi:hypothetical protein